MPADNLTPRIGLILVNALTGKVTEKMHNLIGRNCSKELVRFMAAACVAHLGIEPPVVQIASATNAIRGPYCRKYLTDYSICRWIVRRSSLLPSLQDSPRLSRHTIPWHYVADPRVVRIQTPQLKKQKMGGDGLGADGRKYDARDRLVARVGLFG